jgi:hypothetical protein
MTVRRFAPAAVAALGAAALAVPAAAHAADTSPIVVDAAQDSVLVTGLPFGQTTLQVTRPDALTGSPVVIGQYQGLSFPGLPFSVNTTTPTFFNPGGDCWQSGSLSLPGSVGLTPDIQPGDTVGVVGGPSVKVTAADASGGGPGGPIAGCAPISTWGRNVVTDASSSSPGSDLSVSGTAQPLAKGVSVSATDGTNTTAPVDATLAADGSWTATIPAASLASLADGPIAVNGDFAVPDVSSGAAAHIGGVPFSLQKQTPATPAASAPTASPAAAAPSAPASVKLSGLITSAKISLHSARTGHISVSFIVPTGAKLVRVRLARAGRTAALKIETAARPGSRQTVHLTGAGIAKITRGTYKVTVGAGASRTQLGSPVLRGSVRVH